MKNNNYSHMDVDPAFEPLIELEHAISPTRVRAYRAYRQWVVGYSEEEIATFFSIPTDEVATDLEYIRELLPAETVALNIRERNEILESKESASKLIEELATDMFPSAEEIIQAGKNPVDILRRFRKVVTSDDPLKMIPELRRENSRAAIKDHDVDLSERDNSLIAELCGRKPAQPIMPENSEKYEYPCDPTEQTSPASAGPDQKQGKVDRRITVRLDPELHEKVRQYSQDAGMPSSLLVRMALTQFLQDNNPTMETKKAEMPQEALSLTGRYQTWGSDLREELDRQFLRTLAVAYTTSRRWHRDERSRQIYERLIQLYYNLDGNDVRQK